MPSGWPPWRRGSARRNNGETQAPKVEDETMENLEIVLSRRPEGRLTPDHFEARPGPVREPGHGEVLVRTLYLSIDPANRAWMSPVPTYTAPVNPGDVMAGFALGQVVQSNDPAFQVGDLVEGATGWRRFAVVPGKSLRKRDMFDPPTALLSVLGITGKTAWFGMAEIGRPRAGEVVLVSAAAGAVGSIAGQIAKNMGAKVIGIAGGEAKCRHVMQDLGFDAAIDYKAERVPDGLKRLGIKAVDVYFDNVGGEMLEGVLFRMANFGRIVCCGNVSQYDTATPAAGPRGVPGLLVVKRLRMEGFIVLDYESRYEEAETDLARMVADGQLKYREDISEGLASAPAMLVRVLAGGNVGKALVRVED